MSIIPPDWLPWLAAAVAAFAVDQWRFGGKYSNMALDKISGNTFDVWTLRPETRFRGKNVQQCRVLGYKDRISNNGTERQTLTLAFIDSEGNSHMADADDLDIPPQALKRWYVDAYDIGLRSDRLRQTQEENDQLRTRLAAANAKANQAFSNSLDFTTKMTAQMGDWKKNIGTAPPILAGKAGANAWQIQQQQEAEGETP